MTRDLSLPPGFERYVPMDFRGRKTHPLANLPGVLVILHPPTNRRFIVCSGNLAKRVNGIRYSLRANHTPHRRVPDELCVHYDRAPQVEYYYMVTSTYAAARVEADKLRHATQDDPRYYNRKQGIKNYYKTATGKTVAVTRGRHRCIPVIIQGIEYPSITEASKTLNLSSAMIRYRLTSLNFPDFTIK